MILSFMFGVDAGNTCLQIVSLMIVIEDQCNHIYKRMKSHVTNVVISHGGARPNGAWALSVCCSRKETCASMMMMVSYMNLNSSPAIKNKWHMFVVVLVCFMIEQDGVRPHIKSVGRTGATENDVQAGSLYLD